MRIHPIFAIIAVPLVASGILALQIHTHGFQASQPADSSSESRPAADSDRATEPSTNGTLEGTTWEEKESNGSRFTYRFGSGGILRYTSDSGQDYSNATWSLQGDGIAIEFNGGYAKMQGRLSGSHMEGSASNVNGLSWAWTAQRVFSPHSDSGRSAQAEGVTPPAVQSDQPSSEEMRSKRVAAHLKKAKALWSSGQVQEAITECDAALKLDPENEEATTLREKYQRAQDLLNGSGL